MPPQVIPPAEMTALLRHLRTIERREPPLPRRTVRLTDGATIEGEVLGEGFDDLQIRTSDKRIHLLRKQGDRVRRVTSEVDWPTYNGETGGNRHTTLRGIDKANVTRLAPRWMATVAEAGSLQVTPVVVDGHHVRDRAERVLSPSTRAAGRRLWRYKRPRTKGVSGGWANRGVAVAGDRVFMMTDHAHVIALDRFTGALLWDTALADWRQNYAASSAPLPAGDLVVTGVAGGEHGANGFVAAVDQATGKEVWRFRTVPRPGEPGSETWQGKDIEHGGAPTWFTGSYDPALDLVYWPTGNPSKEYDGSDRLGRQPVRVLHPGARAQDRAPAVALPVHAARPVGLGCHADVGRRRRRVGRAPAPVAAARRSATASSTCSTASRASACSRRPS